ncbi:hypothetical protein PVL29_017002 [Vitis rotundifolia]|uniref:Amino acid transporter transmembrane domain-containing protein n=2 Tax=Vitis rotundifolia TaxID=103349 RepID=A0AA38Z9N2_VITRO|nr:hypothetical protein PVL29_017002 [Vitis rotundifolia]
MATVLPTTMDVSTKAVDTPINPPKDLDAGALFVLKSKGSWLHCGYHLTTSIVAPVLLSLPFAMALLGWVAGVMWLALAAVVTFYSYNLLSLVLEHHAKLGHRHLRFRDMATHILGPGWGRYFVGPLQFGICYGAVIACSLLGGQSLKFIYLLCRPNGSMQLYQFIIMFGVLLLFLAQIPSFHSLRHMNLVSLVLCLAYSACAAAGSIHIGSSSKAPLKDYSLSHDRENRLFGAFNGISIIATTYASGIIPEIQATIAPPVTGKMFKGLCICYTVIIMTYFSVGISGYWAFGNGAQGSVLSNFISGDNPLLPTWFLLMTNVFTITQLAAVSVVYLQPTNEVLEGFFANPKKDPFSLRNTIPRLIFRSLTVVIGTTIAAMLPFFGDIMALFGALGCIPLDFILPMIFYNVSFKPSKKSLVFWINTTIAVVSSALAAVGAVSAVRQMVLDTKTYHLFANV